MIARNNTPIAPSLDRETWRRIRRKAKQLVGKAGLRQADREDIEQELALQVWRGLQNFQPGTGRPGAFVAMILERAANSLLRLRNSSKRGGRHVHQPLVSECEAPEESLHSAEASCALCSTDASHEAIFALTHDVNVVLGQLPPSLQRLAEELKHHTVAEVARGAGLSRSTIYARIAQLRAAFAAADLKNFPLRSDTSSPFCEV
jgi:DNA-directed RNA polymerase specialized sigma24 family protein